MANLYGLLFTAPGSVAFSVAGFVARMPLSMAGVGIITMLSRIVMMALVENRCRRPPSPRG